jgi:uncharacterized protein (TIGR02145 family)
MKKLLIAFALTNALFSCKKEKTNTNSTTNSSNGVSCVDNPNINFTAIGTPVGKFSDCIKDVDGNTYKTVTIGTQTWMAENLKTSKYNDGTSIPNVKDSLEWSKLTTGAWCYYNNDEKNNSKYGKLYNWYAVSKTTNGNKNVCPTGWHVPSDAEWTVLSGYLGGESVAGGNMKEVGKTSWNITNSEVINVSLYTGLPGGLRSDIGDYRVVGNYGVWWCSTERSSNGACNRILSINDNGIGGSSYSKGSGFSVRCLKD